MLHYLSHLFWCFPIILDRTFRVALILLLIKLLLLILLLKRPNLALKKEGRDLRFLPPPLFFFSFFFNCFHSDMHSRSSACLWRNCCFNAMVFIHLSLESGSLLLGAAQLIWGLGFFFSTYCLHVIGFLSLLGWCSHLSDTYQSKTSIVFCGTRFYFLLLICYKWIWIACKTKEMRQVIVFFSLSEKDLGDLL